MWIAEVYVVSDFWGAVVPTWIGAVGGAVSTVIGAAAFVSSQRNRRGVEEIGRGLNTAARAGAAAAGPVAGAAAPGKAADGAPAAGAPAAGTGPRTAYSSVDDVVWTVSRDGRRHVLRNESASQPATLVSLSSATPVTVVRPLVALPAEVTPLGVLPFAVDRRFTGPSVTAVEVVWSDGPAGTRTVTLWV
jgi:hypothetical protein